MKIENFSIVAGTTLCNASCPYCISKMTPKQGMALNEPEVNWRNFRKACRLAELNNVSSVLITGKGEPTLYPEQITKFLKAMKEFDFPIIELQTNGLLLSDKKYESYLKEWYDLGLTLIAVSIVHYKSEKNKEVFTPFSNYVDLEKLMEKLHNFGFSVRLSFTMIRGFVDNANEVEKLINQAREWRVEQLSLRELAKPKNSINKQVFDWTLKNTPSRQEYDEIKNFVKENGSLLLTFGHGALLYDVKGQNVCLTDALTIQPDSDNLRQIIFFPDGKVKFDWQFQGATLL